MGLRDARLFVLAAIALTGCAPSGGYKEVGYDAGGEEYQKATVEWEALSTHPKPRPKPVGDLSPHFDPNVAMPPAAAE